MISIICTGQSATLIFKGLFTETTTVLATREPIG